MIKEDQFLFIVQTIILTNGINLSSQAEYAAKYRHVYSATGVLGLMNDAIYASKRIPEKMSAFEAADEFCGFMLDNLRQSEETAKHEQMRVPSWFARS